MLEVWEKRETVVKTYIYAPVFLRGHAFRADGDGAWQQVRLVHTSQSIARKRQDLLHPYKAVTNVERTEPLADLRTGTGYSLSSH